MTTVHLSGRRAVAVSYLLRNTSLDGHPFLRVTNDDPTLTVEWVITAPHWSSGERVLLDLIASIGGKASGFYIANLDDLDSTTRLTAVWAVGIAAGAWSDYERPARIEEAS